MANQRSEDAGNTLGTGAVLFLERNPGLPFCEPCLAHELSVRRDEVRKAMRGLDARLFLRAHRWCVRCLRLDSVIYAAGRTPSWLETSTAQET